MLVGKVDEALRAHFGVQHGVGGQLPGDFLVVEHVAQAVRAEQVEVAVYQRMVLHVQQHEVFHAQRARDQVVVARHGRFRQREQAAVNLLLQQGMVARDLLEFAAAPEVGARIARVPEHHFALMHHRHHQRGAHAVIVGVGVGGFKNAAVGGIHAHRHGAAQVAQAGAAVVRQPFAKLLRNQGHSHAAGDFAGVVPAHAVGEHDQPVLRDSEHGVLVVVSQTPHVAQGDVLNLHSPALLDRAGHNISHSCRQQNLFLCATATVSGAVRKLQEDIAKS